MTEGDVRKAGVPMNLDGSVDTTAGRYVMNLFLFASEDFRSSFPYVNEPLSKKGLRNVEDKAAELLVEGSVSSQSYMDWIDRLHWLAFSTVSFLGPSLDISILKTLPSTKAVLDRRLKGMENGDSLDEAGMKKVQDAEKEALEAARSALRKQDTPGMQLYDSGAAGSFETNYKNTSVMRGAIASVSDPNALRLSKSNLNDGYQEDEMHMYGDIMVQAMFSRAVGTQDGGYQVNQYNAAFSHITLDDEGTDCGTKQTLEVSLTERNKEDYWLRYAVNAKGELLLLKGSVRDSLVGRKIRLRSPLYCLSERICSKCAGELYHRLGTRRIGGIFSKIGSQLLNRSLKKFHDMTIKTQDLDVIGSFKPVAQ